MFRDDIQCLQGFLFPLNKGGFYWMRLMLIVQPRLLHIILVFFPFDSAIIDDQLDSLRQNQGHEALPYSRKWKSILWRKINNEFGPKYQGTISDLVTNSLLVGDFKAEYQ
jgi:hypothetical protein